MTSAQTLPSLAAAMGEVDALVTLLRKENGAIEGGDLQSVIDLYPAKLEFLEKFESNTAEIQGFLAGDGADGLKAKVEELGTLVARNEALLARTGAAAAEIAEEIGRIRDRHSLKGLYGKSGEQVGKNSPQAGKLDHSV